MRPESPFIGGSIPDEISKENQDALAAIEGGTRVEGSQYVWAGGMAAHTSGKVRRRISMLSDASDERPGEGK